LGRYPNHIRLGESGMTKGIKTKTQTSDEKSAAGLLTPEERRICEGVVSAGEAPWSQRAQVLLAMNQGNPESVAAESAGLRDSQVRYWLNAFRRKRTDIFPEQILKGTVADSSVSEPDDSEEKTAVDESPGKTKKNKGDKKNKKSKGKQVKRAKKTKKRGKKSKKGKQKKKK